MKIAVVFENFSPFFSHSEALAAMLKGKGYEVEGIVLGEEKSFPEKAAKICGKVTVISGITSLCCQCAAHDLTAIITKNDIALLIAPAGPVADCILPVVALNSEASFIPYFADFSSKEGHLTFSRKTFSGRITENIIPSNKRIVATYGDSPLFGYDTKGAAAGSIATIPASACSHQQNDAVIFSENAKNPFAKTKSVICCGSVIGERKRFERSVVPLARKLSCQPAVTLDAANEGIFDREFSVSAQGASCDAQFYLSLGSYGFMEHLEAIRMAKFVVAVNSDPHSRIYSRADIRIQGNIPKILYRLEEKIARMMKL